MPETYAPKGAILICGGLVPVFSPGLADVPDWRRQALEN
jgi:hypothetical protein